MVFDPLRFRSIRFPVAVPLLSSFFPLFSNFWFVLRRFPAGISAVVHVRSPACASPTPSRFGVRSRPASRLVRPPPPARRDVQRTHSLASVFWVFTRGGS